MRENEKITSFYMNKNEYQILKAKIEKTGISQSSYIRELILNVDYIEHRTDFIDYLEANKMILENIQRIGSNINQIARALNMDIKQSEREIAITMQSLLEILNDYKQFILTSRRPKLIGKRKFK